MFFWHEVYQHSLIRNTNSNGSLHQYAMNMNGSFAVRSGTSDIIHNDHVHVQCQCYFSCNHLIIVVSTEIELTLYNLHIKIDFRSVSFQSVEHLHTKRNTFQTNFHGLSRVNRARDGGRTREIQNATWRCDHVCDVHWAPYILHPAPCIVICDKIFAVDEQCAGIPNECNCTWLLNIIGIDARDAYSHAYTQHVYWIDVLPRPKVITP